MPNQQPQPQNLSPEPDLSQPSPSSLLTELSLTGLLEKRAHLKAQADSLNQEIQTLNELLTMEMVLREATSLEIDRFKISYTETKRESLNKQKLLEAGVSVKQIQQGTVFSSYQTLRVLERDHE